VGCVADGTDVFLDQVLQRNDTLGTSVGVHDAGEVTA
jgi:hypothetical protein